MAGFDWANLGSQLSGAANFGTLSPQEQAAMQPNYLDRLTSAIGQGAIQAAAAPGNALQSTPDNPVTTEQMVAPAANLASMLMLGTAGTSPAGAIGSGPVIDMQGWAEARRMSAIRQNNLHTTFANGGGVMTELPNKWMIGYLPGSSNDVSHVLLSPQGGPALYGSSPTDLIKRGFYKEDAAPLLNFLGNK